MTQTKLIVGPEQHTEAWHAMRKSCITSSDAAVLMDCAYSKSDTLLKRWQEKKGLTATQTETVHMARGTELEPFARAWCESGLGIVLKPMTVIHSEIPGFMTSLDGISEDEKTIIEIKCGKKSFQMAEKGVLEPYYYAQCQWHLLVTGLPEIHYVCFDGFSGISKVIKREESYIEELKARALVFLECIEKNIPPGDEEREIKIECPQEYVQALEMYIQLDGIEKRAAEEKKAFREVLLNQGDDGNFFLTIGGVPKIKAVRTEKEGAVDWKAVCAELKIPEEVLRRHKKKSIGYYTLTICKEKS